MKGGMSTFHPYLERAVEIAGSQRALAEKAGLSQQGISWLLTGGAKNISAEVAVKIEKATAGEITRHMLRPDLFGEAA